MQWPPYEADKIAVCNPDAGLALVILWRRQDTIVPRLTEAQRAQVCAIGNLYSKDGINLLLRNVLAKPTIRRLLITGPDLSSSGEALLALGKHGVGEDRAILGIEDARIDAEIPLDALEQFRANVELVDLRQGFDLELLEQYAIERPHAWADPVVYPPRKLVAAEIYPSEHTGVRIEGRRVADAWLDVLYHIMRFGVLKGSEYGTRQRELLNVLTVITDEDPTAPHLQPELPFTTDELAEYYQRTLTAIRVPDVTYTYGQRLRDFHGVDQIAYIVQKLSEAPTSRRALAVTWDHFVDPKDSNPPCLNTVQATIQDGALYLTATLRSNDMFASWPRNAFALRELQRQLSEELGTTIGPLTMLSQSAHIYEHDWQGARAALERFRTTRLALSDFDPRGNLLITLDREAGELVVQHQSPEGRPLNEYRAKDAASMLRTLDQLRVYSLPSHAAYIGLELGRAELCLMKGAEYIQDRAPSL